MLTVIAYLTFAIIIVIYFVTKNIYNYWSRKKVIGPKPLPIFGNYAPVFFGYKSEGELLREIYENYNDDFVGIYKGLQPVLIVRNLTIVKQILLKKFDFFNARCIENPLNMYHHSLYVMKGDAKWKNLRNILAPGMLSDRIQKMIPLIQNSANKFVKYVDVITNDHRYFEIRNLNTKYTIDVYSKLIFNKERDMFGYNNFVETVTGFINSKLQLSLSHITQYLIPPVSSIVLNIQNSFNVYDKVLKDNVASLIREVEMKGVKRNNLLEFLIGMKETGKTRKDKDLPVEINNDFIIQQSLTLFLTAFESTTSVIAFVIYEIAQNEVIQNKCLKEINEVFNQHNGEITLDLLSQMNYLEQVINETMRKHAIQLIDRKCLTNYKLPDTNITIDKNVFVYIPVHGLHNDPQYYPNPGLFDPDRFSAENKDSIPQFAFLPFGDGPRMCIGYRLAKIVIIIGVSAFLRKYKVAPFLRANNNIKYEPRRTRTLMTQGGLWVKVEKRLETS